MALKWGNYRRRCRLFSISPLPREASGASIRIAIQLPDAPVVLFAPRAKAACQGATVPLLYSMLDYHIHEYPMKRRKKRCSMINAKRPNTQI
jgi:hypothetical protein